MDDRWRFLYCDMTELWGHGRRCRSRGWNTRGKRRIRRGGKPPRQGKGAMRTELRVGKPANRPSRKAAIVHAAPVP